jgi:glycosyltransferase involved in cell wall biosynthesis
LSAEVSSRPLRIGIVTDALRERVVDGEARIANGGVGVYIYQLIHNLLAADPINHYFLIRFGKGALDIYRDPRAHNIFLPTSRLARGRALLGGPYSRPARELKLDLVHFPNMFGGASLRAPVKVVATLQDLTPLIVSSTHPRHRVLAYRMLTGRALRKADRIIVPSSATGRDLIDRGLAPAEKITRIALGVSPIFKQVDTTAEFDVRYQMTKPFILTVGVLEPRKNQKILLDVLRRLHQQGRQMELVIIGREGWHWTNPLATPEYKDLRPHVKILTDVSDADLVEFYNRAKLFIYPSFYEGFGLPILEAMACGTPVIASNASSMPEVAGTAALLADPHDWESFAEQARRVIDSPGLEQQMIETGLRHAREFTWRKTAEATLAVYREMVS